jgi:eukaryotic-like serine/threonine-protein kinase
LELSRRIRPVTIGPGSRIGSYEVTALIGEGGMGRVWRAHHTALNRDDAMKVLPDAFAADPERLARFQREAQVLASLNHPNIAHVYGLEQADGIKALVMELVEGPTLADRIAQGPIPIDEAVPIAKQIAEALEAAHEQGIVHRDLKPANVKVRPDGAVKVLDFGLAKAIAPADNVASNVTLSRTITSPAMTQVGMILGTAAYMSPEQAKGRAADKRSDIWAFGCVLYEMLTGVRAFGGDDVSDTLASVLAREPDWARLPPDVSAGLVPWLQRCLRKERKERVGDIHDLRLVLEGAFETRVGPAIATAAPAMWRRPLSIALVAASIGAAVGGGLMWALQRPAPSPVMRSRFVLPADQQFGTFIRQVIGVSPNGSEIVYQASGQLILRTLSDLTTRPITAAESSTRFNANANPVFSPDGRFIAYYDGALKKIATRGGTPVTLCATDLPWGMSWDGDAIVFGQGPKGIRRVSANGGTPEQLVTVAGSDLTAHPQMLPGRRAVLFTLATAASEGEIRWDSARIVVQTLGSDERKVLIEGGSDARYLSTGHIVFAQGATLFAVPFDEQRLEVTGGRVPVVEGVMRNSFIGDGSAHYSVSETGTLVFVPAELLASAGRIISMDAKGVVTPVLPPSGYRSLRISPNGRAVAYDAEDGAEADIWIYELAGGGPPRRLTFRGRNHYPIWSPDGQRIVFQSDREATPGLYWQRADGTGTAERLTMPDKGTSHIPESWSPTGDRVSFSAMTAAGVSLWTFSLPDKKAEQFGNVQSFSALNSEFSPDGRWLAYTLRTSTTANIFVEPFPATGEKQQITTGNGHHPVWLANGLSYRIAGGQQVIVPVDTTSRFTVGNPVPVVSRPLPVVVSSANRSYDLTRDGTRVMAVSRDSDPRSGVASAQQIEIVVNWTEELKRLVPTK